MRWLVVVALLLSWAGCDDSAPGTDAAVPDLAAEPVDASALPPDFAFPALDCGPTPSASGPVSCGDLACGGPCALIAPCSSGSGFRCCADGGCAGPTLACAQTSDCAPLACGTGGCCASYSTSSFSGNGCFGPVLAAACAADCQARFVVKKGIDSEQNGAGIAVTTRLCHAASECGDPLLYDATAVGGAREWRTADRCCQIAWVPSLGFCLPSGITSYPAIVCP